MIDQNVIDAQVAELLDGVPDGEGLDERQVLLIGYGLRCTGSALDVAGTLEWQERALAFGISVEELQEVVTLQSSAGMHAYFESTRELAKAAEPRGGWGPFDAERQALWDRYVGTRRRWTSMQTEIPGFLEALLRLSPQAFEAFINYVKLPFASPAVDNLTHEMIAMASDASPAHQYLPGMRMHLRNAVQAGSGRLAIEHAMRLAAESPNHVGVA